MHHVKVSKPFTDRVIVKIFIPYYWGVNMKNIIFIAFALILASCGFNEQTIPASYVKFFVGCSR